MGRIQIPIRPNIWSPILTLILFLGFDITFSLEEFHLNMFKVIISIWNNIFILFSSFWLTSTYNQIPCDTVVSWSYQTRQSDYPDNHSSDLKVRQISGTLKFVMPLYFLETNGEVYLKPPIKKFFIGIRHKIIVGFWNVTKLVITYSLWFVESCKSG